MTALWLLIWGLTGTHAVVAEDLTTAPYLNVWAIALVICVALDLGKGAT